MGESNVVSCSCIVIALLTSASIVQIESVYSVQSKLHSRLTVLQLVEIMKCYCYVEFSILYDLYSVYLKSAAFYESLSQEFLAEASINFLHYVILYTV